MRAAMTSDQDTPFEVFEADLAATPEETLEDLLRRSRRTRVPIRRSFLQTGNRSSRPGPLHRFVAERRPRALDIYALLHAGASAEPWDVTQPAMSWARMLSMPETASSEASISRTWSWLEQQQLVSSERAGRLRKVSLLLEDGSGRPYSQPRGREPDSRGYFNVPFEYFRKGWHLELSLAGKATLFICLAQGHTFTLPTPRASVWYGVSSDTLQRGLDELRRHGLVQRWTRTVKAPRARHGLTRLYHYRLTGAFAQPPAELPSLSATTDADTITPQAGAGAVA
jgi:hypothetical protein